MSDLTTFGEPSTMHVAESSRKRENKYLSPDAKAIVLNVYNGLCSELSKADAIKETIFLTQVPQSTVYSLVSGNNKPRRKRKDEGKFKKIEQHLITPISRTIYDMYAANRFPTIESLRTELIKKEILKCSESTIRRFLKANGFRYKKIDKRKSIMESGRLISLRNEYIRNITDYRGDGKNIVYLDETWFDTHDTVQKSWTNNHKQCTAVVPCNKGKRIIILHCGGEDGWVEGALMLSAKNISDSSLDYHQDMESGLFEHWFENILIPKLKANSVIVMDNASYHSREITKIPNSQSLKLDIQEFLFEQDLFFGAEYKKRELLEVVHIKEYTKQRFIDECAAKYGHTVLRLPPYYCVLNPIEMLWAQLKTNVRKNNVSPKFSAEVLNLIKKEVNNITSTNWKSVIRHVIDIEKDYEKSLPTFSKLVINLNVTDESDISEESSDSEGEITKT